MESLWADVIGRTKDFIKGPERFLVQDGDQDFEKSKILLKVLYDGAKMTSESSENFKSSKQTLPEMIIEDFDEEQVWTGVELQNKHVLDAAHDKLEKLVNLPKNCFTFSNNQNSSSTFETRNFDDSDEEDDLPMEDIHEDDDTGDHQIFIQIFSLKLSNLREKRSIFKAILAKIETNVPNLSQNSRNPMKSMALMMVKEVLSKLKLP